MKLKKCKSEVDKHFTCRKHFYKIWKGEDEHICCECKGYSYMECTDFENMAKLYAKIKKEVNNEYEIMAMRRTEEEMEEGEF